MRRKTLFTGWMFWMAIAGALCAQTPLGTSFTYQGQLSQTGKPANGAFDMEFYIYDDPDPLVGAVIGMVTMPGVVIDAGLFTVELDFGAVFSGDAYWLELRVWDANLQAFVPLIPLQAFRAKPYSLYSLRSGQADSAATADDADFLDGLDSGAFALVGTLTTGDLDMTGTVAATAFDLNGQVITSWSSDSLWSSGIGTDIFYDGNIGIGTADPMRSIHVLAPSGSPAVVRLETVTSINNPTLELFSADQNWTIINRNNGGDQFQILDATLDEERLVIDKKGEMGIGTTDPQRSIHVVAPPGSPAVVRLETVTSINNPTLELHSADQNWAVVNRNNGGDQFQILDATLDEERLVITKQGRVGIGTTDPEAELDVTGRAHADVYGKRMAELLTVPQNTVTTFDLCTKEGGMLLINGSSQGNLYQTVVLYLFQVGSFNPAVLLRATEAGNNLGQANFTLTDIGGNSSGSTRCNDWFRTIELRATGSSSQQSATLVALSTSCAGCL